MADLSISDDLWKQLTHARILVSDPETDNIIGRGGSTIAAIQSTSGAHVQLSRRGQLLPGTQSRVLLLSGLFHQVMYAAEILLQQIICQVSLLCSALLGLGFGLVCQLDGLQLIHYIILCFVIL
jgi:predicted RNA-binding protein YlqC (UPF0109 family)